MNHEKDRLWECQSCHNLYTLVKTHEMIQCDECHGTLLKVIPPEEYFVRSLSLRDHDLLRRLRIASH